MLTVVRNFVANYEMITKNSFDQLNIHPEILKLVVGVNMMLVKENLPWWIVADRLIAPENFKTLTFCYQQLIAYFSDTQEVPEVVTEL